MVVKASIPYETVEGESATAEERKICNPVQRALNLGRGGGPERKFEQEHLMMWKKNQERVAIN